MSTWIDLHRQAALETNRLTQTARVIGSLASDAVVDGDRAGSFEAVRSVNQMPGIRYARIESARHGLLAETGAGARLISDATLQGGEDKLSIWSVLSTGSVQVSAPIMSEGRPVGTITLFSRTPELRGRVLSTIWTTLAGAAFALIAGLIVAMRMARKISRPIVALAGLVRKVHDTNDYSTEVDVTAEGEVADLVVGIDSMLKGIRERDARIAAQVLGLESEVAARTGDLVIARDAAEQANAAKSDFLAVMSHEIRTPLNGILALSDMLATSNLPQRQQRYADVISKSGRSLLSIINDILDFSKIEAGKMDMETVEVDLAEAAEDVASLFSEKAASKNLDLAVFVDPRLPLVLTDPTRLRQVIGNLVNNAIKFTDTGGVLIAIDTDPSDSTRIRVAVHDTGPGIPAEKLPTLFEAFTQADQSTTRIHGGTGLGLAICDRLVRSMGGEWALTSTLAEGSVFAFSAPFGKTGSSTALLPVRPGWSVRVRDLTSQTHRAILSYLEAWGVGITEDRDAATIAGKAGELPLCSVVICESEDVAQSLRSADADACAMVKPVRVGDLRDVLSQMQEGLRPRLANEPVPAVNGITFPGLRVLVVDDSDVNLEVATEALGRLGVETFLANDGQQAVEQLRAQSFDMVLMDGSMPVLDGFDATRAIRAEEVATGRPRATILALTAHVVGSGADAWKSAGMDGVIHKPFTLSDLIRELSRFCGTYAVHEASPAVLPTALTPDEFPVHLFDASIRSGLLEMGRNGRSDFVDRVHRLYAVNAPLRLEDIKQAVAGNDSDDLARAAHALKSMSLSLGASAVAVEASKIETASRSGQPASSVSIEAIETLVALTISAMAEPLDEPPVQLSAEDELALGIQNGDLHLVYQPLVERRGQLSGKVEALVRWNHPQHGRLCPDDFIPRLEKEGGIMRLTDFVMTRVMQDLQDRPDIRVSINASASEFQRPDFAFRVVEAAAAMRFPAERLEIEVTETAMLDVEAARHTIEALRTAGFGVALDDFGAGYTSLHALRELRFTTLKVDRSFVERCTDDTASAAIIHAVIGVGRALGMKVVCEGVETSEQAEFLRIAGSHYLQGYYFHRPLTLAALSDMIRQAA